MTNPSTQASRPRLHAEDIAHVVHPYSNLAAHDERGPTLIVRGEGCYIHDDSGKRYLEGMSGLWCAALGFSEPRLVEAAIRQLRTLPYYHLFNHRSHPPGIELAARLAALAPANLNHVLFANSGSEANDAAVKLVWYYNNALGRPEKKKIISRRNAYHGVTVAAGSLTGIGRIHADFDLPIARVLHADCPSYHHFREPGEREAEFARRLVDNLEALILEEGPETIAAFIAEPVMGAGGIIVPPAGYFAGVQAVLEKYDVLLIADEVICGFGRTGQCFGSDTYGLRPDLMSVAKALSSAYQPISALIVSDAIHAAMQEESRKLGAFAHGLTYAAHPVAAAVALETLDIYEERDIFAHVRQIAPEFLGRLAALKTHPLVADVRGVGLLAGVEIATDKTKTAITPEATALGAWVQNRACARGLILRAIGPVLALCPPLIIETAQIDEILAILQGTLDEALVHARENRWL
ncbi:MAG: aminotransferase class III-fold pyridoxal phosphate-dependent enzyme [Candidatus Accumulibacter sp.]|nr:aminotransferase class III-fold pyridoxal phosphate-dependent enzyme [Accumulibacter sp.]